MKTLRATTGLVRIPPQASKHEVDEILRSVEGPHWNLTFHHREIGRWKHWYVAKINGRTPTVNLIRDMLNEGWTVTVASKLPR